MDPLLVAVAGSSVLSVASMVVAVFRRRTVITAQLQVELDLAVEQNARLVAELAQTKDELHAVAVKVSPELLEKYAVQAVAYGAQMGGTNPEKLAHAIHAAQRLDAGDNGKRDFTDAQLRIAIESEISRKK